MVFEIDWVFGRKQAAVNREAGGVGAVERRKYKL